MRRVLLITVLAAGSLAAASIGAGPAARAAQAQTCDQRMMFLQFRADSVHGAEAREQFNAALAQAKLDRDAGDERACQADIDAAERLLPTPPPQ